MAETVITPILASRIAPTTVVGTVFGTPFVAIDVANGNSFTNKTNRYALLIYNLHATNALTCTVAATKAYSGINLPDQANAVAALSFSIFGPFSSDFEGTDKLVTMAWTGSGATGRVALLEIVASDV
jgi:hypothetical protein